MAEAPTKEGAMRMAMALRRPLHQKKGSNRAVVIGTTSIQAESPWKPGPLFFSMDIQYLFLWTAGFLIGSGRQIREILEIAVSNAVGLGAHYLQIKAMHAL